MAQMPAQSSRLRCWLDLSGPAGMMVGTDEEGAEEPGAWGARTVPQDLQDGLRSWVKPQLGQRTVGLEGLLGPLGQGSAIVSLPHQI